MANQNNNTGRVGLPVEKIDEIINTYKEVRSIAKTAKIVGVSTPTVNKYVLSMSSKDKHSVNASREIISCKDGKEQLHKSARKAAEELNINYSGIIKVLSGKLSHIGGYTFKYKE